MKKFILCLVLCLVFSASIFSFSACKKAEGYKLSSIEDDYKSIADNCKSVIYNTENKRLEFDYSIFVNANENEYLVEALNNQDAPYKHLNDYNTVLYNSLCFVNNNIHNMATDAFDVSQTLINDAKSKIDNLKRAFEKVDIQVQEFARNINTNSGRDNKEEALTNELYLQTFKHLLDSYNALYERAFDATISFAKIYYSITSDYQTTDLSATDLSGLNNEQKLEIVSNFITGLQNRTNLAISSYSYVFYLQNLQNGDMSKNLITKQNGGFASLGAEYETYLSALAKISKKPSQASLDYVTEIYQSSIELFNIWSVLTNDFEKYFKAYSTINFNLLKTSFDLSNYETNCIKIIEDYHDLLKQNVQLLIKVYNYV